MSFLTPDTPDVQPCLTAFGGMSFIWSLFLLRATNASSLLSVETLKLYKVLCMHPSVLEHRPPLWSNLRFNMSARRLGVRECRANVTKWLKKRNQDEENNAPSVELCTDRVLCCYDQGSITCKIYFASFFLIGLFYLNFLGGGGIDKMIDRMSPTKAKKCFIWFNLSCFCNSTIMPHTALQHCSLGLFIYATCEFKCDIYVFICFSYI